MRRFLVSLAGLFIAGSLVQAQDCTELFISEYVEGSGNNKGVEIYNPTENIVDLSAYYVARYSNGAFDYTAGGITQLTGFLPGYDVHILVNGQTTSTETSPACDPAMQALADQLDGAYPAPTYMNGNDAIALFKDTGGSGDINDFVLVDLFGIIGGGMQSTDVGWASFTDAYVYKNVYDNDGNITGKDSVWISHYIVPEGYYWVPWSKDHSLIRKRSVMAGVTVATMPSVEFNVTAQWDTVTGGIDIWDSLGTHLCNCEYGTPVLEKAKEPLFASYPNPVGHGYIVVKSQEPISSMELYNLAGVLVYREDCDELPLERTFRIPDDLKGLMMMKIYTGSGSSYTDKIIVQ